MVGFLRRFRLSVRGWWRRVQGRAGPGRRLVGDDVAFDQFLLVADSLRRHDGVVDGWTRRAILSGVDLTDLATEQNDLRRRVLDLSKHKHEVT